MRIGRFEHQGKPVYGMVEEDTVWAAKGVQVPSQTSKMIRKVPEFVSYISYVMTLLPGDVILTSTPGVDTLQPGDVVEVEIEGIGVLRNPVVGSGNEPVRWQLSSQLDREEAKK